MRNGALQNMKNKSKAKMGAGIPKRKAPNVNKTSQKKVKPKKSSTSKSAQELRKLRQTRLNLPIVQPPDPAIPPRGGARMEEAPARSASPSRSSFRSLNNLWSDVNYNTSASRDATASKAMDSSLEILSDTRLQDASPFNDSPLVSPAADLNTPTKEIKQKHQRLMDEFVSPEIKMNSRKRHRAVLDSSDSEDLDSIRFEPTESMPRQEIELSGTDSDDIITPLVRRNRRFLPPATKPNSHAPHRKNVLNEELEDVRDTTPFRTHESRAQRVQEPESESEDHSETDSDNIVGPSFRRKRLSLSSSNTIHPSHKTSTLVNEDAYENLQDELRDITASARKNSVTTRIRDAETRNKKKSQFQKNLETLRKKQSGLQPESEEEIEHGRALYDSSSDLESVGSDDFIVEDGHELALEELMEIPPEFTSVSYQGEKSNFKIVVQGEVYALLHPNYHALDYDGLQPFRIERVIVDPENRVLPYFKQAFKSLERQISGITDSAISSNAWKPWFLRALKSRPEFESEEIPGDLRDCDACNIKKRHAKFMVRLSGPTYNPRTLEIIHANNERWCYWDNKDKQFLDEEDVDEEEVEAGNITKVRMDREWALGVYCHDRAETAHYFYHWRWHLREQVKTALRYIHCWGHEKKNYIRNLSSAEQEKLSRYQTSLIRRELEKVMGRLDNKRHIARMYNEYRERIAKGREYLTGGGRGWNSSPLAKRFIRR